MVSVSSVETKTNKINKNISHTIFKTKQKKKEEERGNAYCLLFQVLQEKQPLNPMILISSQHLTSFNAGPDA
jgi:hypothetical protein